MNCYWVIDNSKEVLDRLHNINKVSGAKCFDSYDFATLYTNIPHDGLKSNIRNLVREAYKVREAKYLVVDRHGKAHWSQSPSSVTTCMSIDMSKLVELTEYLIDNVYMYVKAGNRVYRQTIGIPMGTDCAPQLANLYLFHHEYMYMRALMKSNLGMAKRFCNTARYIQYASKKTSHKRTVQRGARSRSSPVHAPFSSRLRLSHSCFCAVCPFFALLNF